MKQIIFLTLISLTSCYTYKPIRTENITKGEVYKVKTGTYFIKIKTDSIAKNIIYYSKKASSGNKMYRIDKSTILEIKKRKFSTVKTIILPVGIIGGLILIASEASKNILRNIDIDIQPPP